MEQSEMNSIKKDILSKFILGSGWSESQLMNAMESINEETLIEMSEFWDSWKLSQFFIERIGPSALMRQRGGSDRYLDHLDRWGCRIITVYSYDFEERYIEGIRMTCKLEDIFTYLRGIYPYAHIDAIRLAETGEVIKNPEKRQQSELFDVV